MRHKRTHITVKRSNPKTYPNLHTNLPYSSKIKDKEWLYKREEEVVISIAEYLVNNPYSLIVLRNKIPEKEKALRVTLDTLVEKHNSILEKYDLTLKLGKGVKFFRLIRARKILKMAGE